MSTLGKVNEILLFDSKSKRIEIIVNFPVSFFFFFRRPSKCGKIPRNDRCPLRSIRYRKPPATSALMIGANRYTRVRKNRNYEFKIKPPGRRIDTETRRTNNILLSRHKRRIIRSFRPPHVRSELSPKKIVFGDLCPRERASPIRGVNLFGKCSITTNDENCE